MIDAGELDPRGSMMTVEVGDPQLKPHVSDLQKRTYSERMMVNRSHELPPYVQPVFLQTNSSQGMWVVTNAGSFAPSNWLPMLSYFGHKCGSGSYGDVYIVNTRIGITPDRDISVAIKKE